MDNLFSLHADRDTADFWHDVCLVSTAVLDVIQRDPGPACTQFLPDVWKKLTLLKANPAALVQRMLACTARLTAMELTGEDSKAPSDQLVAWLLETRRCCDHERQQRGLAKLDYPDDCLAARSNEMLMEGLTAAWLALYFLGLPFVHPWERVRRLSDDSGGFPSGACVTKFIGDLYRRSRLEMAEHGMSAAEREQAQVLVLSYAPSLLLPDLLERDERNLSPQSAHVLGRCYAMFQLRLYASSGYPFTYFVSEQALLRHWQHAHGGYPPDLDKVLGRMAQWLATSLPAPARHQSVLLFKPALPLGMPTCVLSSQVGIYVLDTTQHPLPFAGNHIRKSLLLSYREKLTDLKNNHASSGHLGERSCVELLGLDEPHFRDVVRGHLSDPYHRRL
ncbi:hypothetical protein [Pseudoduganella albidiflava]|uniref:Uncharacterized protein n=1 Tax=Pseudoduganella albidiflava TaxID=321983 RepID=A0A411WZY2_9BURK|nr:hypothetical protein [Pseudoduganella albidiflava]QBI02286.1 hypothetical protein EYF70_16640 [Pseudoduganella albidiflava]GGY67283.1 hypothetical protein GCM10007387_56900 [Pseudoduganella albidiflava]